MYPPAFYCPPNMSVAAQMDRVVEWVYANIYIYGGCNTWVEISTHQWTCVLTTLDQRIAEIQHALDMPGATIKLNFFYLRPLANDSRNNFVKNKLVASMISLQIYEENYSSIMLRQEEYMFCHVIDPQNNKRGNLIA